MPQGMSRVEHMFAFSSSPPPRGPRPPVPRGLKQKVAPVISASARTLPVSPLLSTLLPGGALRRGATTVVHGAPGSGATSFGVSLLAHASSAGHWCAAVGFEDPGVVAMAELGLDLRRAVFVPQPRAGWADAAAELLDGMELILLRPPGRVPHAAARRLMARARERRAALVVVVTDQAQWPVPPEVVVHVERPLWQGAGRGDGRLAARRSEVSVEGRGGFRPRSASVWLPSPTGVVAVADERR